MEDKKIMLVEDNPIYLQTALQILPSKGLIIARNHTEAMDKICSVDSVISDLFFRQNESGSSEEIGRRAIERIKYGVSKCYIDNMNAGLVSRNLEPNERLNRCFYVLGLAKRGHNNKTDADSGILDYLKITGLEGQAKLEEMIRNHSGIDGQWQRELEKNLEKQLCGLREYMNESSDNFPLGYLICEEAEKLGKPFVLATSLRHSNRPIALIAASAISRGWKLIEGADGNKDGLKYWIKAYEKLKEDQ